MLELNEITKSYSMGAADAVQALKGINIKFRRCDLVSILGPSGCGKSTTLNIIGGLDQYTTGDLVINGRSTKGFKDRDWDNYRNHSVGFIFQSYNLIRHQSVLDNVELALTLSGVSKKDRREKAKKALIDVGLGDHVNKTPKEMSGGQMQRVAIARALVNDPDIILADEPTGALDSKTSVQVMEILKQVAKDRLVVMVTHNPELAEQYSTRIIRMKDGEVVEDTRPLSQKEIQAEKERDIQELKAMNIAIAQENKEDVDHTTPRFKIFKNLNNTKLKTPKELIERAKVKRTQPHLSHKDQFKLSLKNLFTKKGRTILTAFAGSVGIFGIGAVLAISQGMNGYIAETEEKTLSSTPLTISSSATDFTVAFQSITDLLKNGTGSIDPTRADDPQVWRKNVIGNLAELVNGVMRGKNNLENFKDYLDKQIATPGSKLNKATAGVFYSYNLDLSTFYYDKDTDTVKESNLFNQITDLITNNLDLDSEIFENINLGSLMPILNTISSLSGGSSVTSLNIWEELLTDKNDPNKLNPMIEKQYELVGNSKWPEEYNEVVVVCDANYEIPDITLYSLGLIPEGEMVALMNDAINGTHEWEEHWKEKSVKNWSLKSIMEKNDYKVIPNYNYFNYVEETKTWSDVRKFPDMIGAIFNDPQKVIPLKISGIIKLKKEFSSGGLIGGTIGYTQKLRNHIIEEAAKSPVYDAQIASPSTDIITGKPFKFVTDEGKQPDIAKKADLFKTYVTNLFNLPLVDGKQYPIDANGLVNEANFARRYYVNVQEQSIEDLTDIIEQYLEDHPLIAGFVSDILSALELDDLEDKIFVLVLLSQGMDKTTAVGYLKQLRESGKYDILKEEAAKKAFETLVLNFDIESDEDRATEFNTTFKEAYNEVIKDSTKTEQEKNEILAGWYDVLIEFSSSTYVDNLASFGAINLNLPSSIRIYANSFGDKGQITSSIDEYNELPTTEESQKIKYADYVGFIMSSVGKILDIITYVLMAFAAISLVVSSIMIAVITLISVQERTKEIGILRAIGASKSNVSGMFRAETVIIGLMSGVLGVILSYILCLPLNPILRNITGAATFTAMLAPWKALILIAISVVLTVLSGLIPSSTAAKKDPVEALRSE